MRGLALVFVAASVAWLGCSSHTHGVSASDPCADGGPHVRLGTFTDEACRAFLDAEARGEVATDATKAPTWTSPSGAEVSSTPPRFAWSKGAIAVSPFRRWLRALNPIGTAWAHGDTTGVGWILAFRDGSGAERLRVMTTEPEYLPDQATWDRLRAGGTVVVTLAEARFTRNELAAGTRPTAAAPRTLTVR
jgi:hypothetical protein